MEKKKHIILIPVYNDWESLKKLLNIIDKNIAINKKFDTEILILDDKSTTSVDLKSLKFNSFKSLSILTVKRNLGSQKVIAIGLNYINHKHKNFVTVIDSDGEDNPLEIEKMLDLAEKNEENIVTSNRIGRKESLLIKFLYKAHLFLTFIFCLKWISFGNFTTFSTININQLLKDKSSWYAHSASVIKNCEIKRLYARREKRFFGKSKLSIFKLIEHSLRINAVFLNRAILMSLLYVVLAIFLMGNNFYLSFFIFILVAYNFAIIFIRIKHYKPKNGYNELIEKVDLI